MKPTLLASTAQLGPLAEQLSEWAEKLLGPYLSAHKDNPYRSSKQIHDPVGKVVELSPAEVFVVDSPILQRLRFVRQLGVGHLLFPSAGYSRFEHSIGAMHMAGLMFDSVVNAQKMTGYQVYTDEIFKDLKIVVRLAALLHDVGHSIFSHVSEKFYSADKAVIKSSDILSKHYQHAVTASEAVTILIIQSHSCRKLISAARFKLSDEDWFVEKLCSAIAGSQSETAPDSFIAEIVNGPVDCDKLDYLARDAYSIGVPISLDIHRLLSKLRVVQDASGGAALNRLAIVPSGSRALEELLVSRIFLYDKFYYHPKVMAAEELIRIALRNLQKAIPAYSSPAELLNYGDDEFLALNEEAIGARHKTDPKNPDLVAACKYIRMARLRKLPKRAFSFAMRFMPEATPLMARFETSGKSDNLVPSLVAYKRDLVREMENPDSKARAAARIQAYASELGGSGDVFIAYQSAQRAAGTPYLPVILPSGKIDDKASFLFKAGEWTEAYALNKATSYVFSMAKLEETYLAAERNFLEMELDFAPNAWLLAKVNDAKLDEKRKTFSGEWLPYRLAPNYLNSQEGIRRVRTQRERFASFLNPVHPQYGPQLVETWVAQFPDSDLKESALRFLEHLEFVETRAVVDSFADLSERQKELKGALWIPLRSIKGKGQSADRMAYDIKDLALRTGHLSAFTAEELTNKTIVFFDDSLNSGTQVSCLFGTWMNRPELCINDSDADVAGALSEDKVDALRSSRIHFAYYAAHPSGRDVLKRMADTLGLDLQGIHAKVDSSEPEFSISSFDAYSAPSKERFVNFIQRRGEELLTRYVKSGKSGWNDDRAKEFALGFGGIQLSLVFTHSISASTPAVLWDMNIELPWIPLFPRDRLALSRRVSPVLIETE